MEMVSWLGCDEIQGNYISPPLRARDFADWLAQPLRKSDPDLLAMMDRQAEALLQDVARLPSAIEAWRRTLVPLIRDFLDRHPLA